jgi:hypothetical protein
VASNNLLFTLAYNEIYIYILKHQMAKYNPHFFLWLAITGAGLGNLATPLAFMAVDTSLQPLQALTIE